MELIHRGTYASREQKLPILQTVSIKLDTLKWLLQIAWEMKVLKNTHYALIAPLLVTEGKIIGGWIKQLTENSRRANV